MYRKNILISIIVIVFVATICGCGSTEPIGNYEHNDTFTPLYYENTDSNDNSTDYNDNVSVNNQDNTSDSSEIIYDDSEERQKLINRLKDDTERIADEVSNMSGDSVPDIDVTNTESFSNYDNHFEIVEHSDYNENIVGLFIMAGYDSNTLDAISTFADKYNIESYIQMSDKITNLSLQGYNSIILNVDNKDYILFISESDIYVKEI